MDKKKIISSLTLAGMLATSVAGSGVFAAETSDPATKALGEYSKLITGKVAVPFILQSEADRVTGKDVKASFKKAATFTFNSTVLADDQVLATGDVVYINGEARTIVIYGDTNCDGKINIMDAVTTLNHVKGKAELTGAAFAAADLNNNGDINILEAVGALNVVKGKAEYENIATAPKAEVSVLKDVVIKNNTTIELTFDNSPKGYTYKITDAKGGEVEFTSVMSENTATITLKNALDNKDEIILTVFDANLSTIATKTITYRTLNVPTPEVGAGADESNPTVIAINDENVKNFDMLLKLNGTTENVNAVETTVTVTLTKIDDNKMTAEAVAKLPANTVSTSVNFGDVSKLDDGDYNIAVKATDANGNIADGIVGHVKVTKASTAPVVYIDAVRSSSDKATVTVNANKTGLTFYAIAKATSNKAPSASELIKDENEFISGNDLDVTSEAQTIYVVAVNDQGTVSNIATTEIANHGIATLDNVDNIKLTKTKYTWDAVDNAKGYLVRVLKGTEVVAETTVTDAEYDIAKVAKENAKVGDKFIISVKALGDNKEYASSKAVVAEASQKYSIPSIEKIDTPVLDKDAKLTWNTTGITEAKSLTIKLYKAFVSETGYEYKEVKTIENVNKSTYEYDLKDVIAKEGVGAYKATVTAIATDDSIKLDSIESEKSSEYVVAKAPTDVTVKVDDTKVTARFSPIVIPGVNNSQNISGLLNNITYKVRVDEKQADGTYTKGTVTEVSPRIATDEKDKVEFDIPGSISITNASDYRITIFAIVDGTEVETKAQEISTPAAMIPSETYTVVKLQNEESAPTLDNTVGITPNGVMKVKVSNVTDTTAFAKAPNYEAIKAVVSKLNETEKIIVTDGKVSCIEVKADNKKARTLDLGTVAEKATLKVTGDTKYYINVLGKVENVELLTGAKYDLSELTVDKTVKTDTNVKELKVANGTTVELNGKVELNGININTTGKIVIDGNVITVKDPNTNVSVEDANVVLKTDKGATITKLTATESTVDVCDAVITTIETVGENNIISKDILDIGVGKVTPLNKSKVTVKYSNANISTITGNVKVVYQNIGLGDIDSTKFTGVSFGNTTLEGQPGIDATYSVENRDLTIEMKSGTIAIKTRGMTVTTSKVEIAIPAGVTKDDVKASVEGKKVTDMKFEDGMAKITVDNIASDDKLVIDWGNGIVETFTVKAQ